MSDKERYVNLADLKRKARAWLKYSQFSDHTKNEFFKMISRLTVTIKGNLETTLQTDEWISVKDRLPEPYTEVAVIYHETSDIDSYAIACCNVFNNWICDLLSFHLPNVTHWMPLPAPPKD